MTTTPEEYGILRFQPVQNFIDPLLGVGRDARIDALMDLLDHGTVQDSAADWTRISRALRRNRLFVLEASTPVWSALLRFDPSNANCGDYRITRQRSARPEVGRIESVKAVSTDLLSSRLSRIAHYSTTFQIVTFTEHGGTRTVWFAGLFHYEQFDDPTLDEIA